jgi:hypothetical protein
MDRYKDCVFGTAILSGCEFSLYTRQPLKETSQVSGLPAGARETLLGPANAGPHHLRSWNHRRAFCIERLPHIHFRIDVSTSSDSFGIFDCCPVSESNCRLLDTIYWNNALSVSNSTELSSHFPVTHLLGSRSELIHLQKPMPLHTYLSVLFPD